MSEHELWNELGNLYYMSGAYPQAVYAYNRSILMDREFGQPYSNMALTYVQQGKYQAAVELYLTGIPLLTDDKERASSWSQLGAVYRQLKNYDQAVEAYQKADLLDPDGSQRRENPSQLLYGGSSCSEADLALLKQELENDPGWESMPDKKVETVSPQPVDHSTAKNETQATPSLLNAAEADELPAKVDEPQDPIELEDEFSEWIPIPIPFESDEEEFDDTEDLVFEGSELNNSRQWELAVENYLPVTPNDRNINQSEEKVPGKFTQTEVALDEAVPLPSFLLADEEPQVELKPTPTRTDASAAEKAEKSRQKEIEVGLARYKWVVQVNPNNAAAWDMLGNLYKSAGQYDDAILAYQQAVNVDPEKTIYLHHLALVYAAVRRDEDAIRTYQKVIQIEPEHGLAHAALGGYFRKMGLEDLAKQHIGKAMRIIYDSENEYNRACLEAISGNIDQALALLRIALDNKQTYVDWVVRDPDLDFIRKDPRFSKLISEYSK